MASLSNNFQLLNSMQPHLKPGGGKKGKKKVIVVSPDETSVTQPEVPPRVNMEEGESEGFQPARRSSARSRSGQLNTKGSSAEDRTPHGRLVKAIETGIKSAQTGEDWLNLWRLWILQVHDQQEQEPDSANVHKALLATPALEESAAACLSTPGLQAAEPLTELLDTFLADASNSHAGLARAVVQLGQATLRDSATARAAAEQCVSAVLQHYKTQCKPALAPYPAPDSQANVLANLESSISELEAAVTQSSANSQEQAKRAKKLYAATQHRLALLSATSPASLHAQQAVSQVECLAQQLEARLQASAATQQAQSDALQARSGLLDEEQVALIAEIEELQSRLAQLEARREQLQQEKQDVAALQASRAGGSSSADPCQRQLTALRNLQAAVAGSARLPDTPSIPDSGAPLEEAALGFAAAAKHLLQANVQLQAEALSKGKFACERMVLAAQQAGHLRSLRFDVDAAKAAAAAAQHETTLLGLIQESSGIMTASLAAGKAANVQHPAMGSDAAAPSGQAIEALMRTTEETHHQLAALLKPDLLKIKVVAAANGASGIANGKLANGNHLRSPDATSSDAVSAAPSIATSSIADSDPQSAANDSSGSSRAGLANGNSHNALNGAKSRRRRNKNASAS